MSSIHDQVFKPDGTLQPGVRRKDDGSYDLPFPATQPSVAALAPFGWEPEYIRMSMVGGAVVNVPAQLVPIKREHAFINYLGDAPISEGEVVPYSKLHDFNRPCSRCGYSVEDSYHQDHFRNERMIP